MMEYDLNAAKAGDKDALERLAQSCVRYVRRLATAKVGQDHVDDICQNVWIKVQNNIANFSTISSLKKWLSVTTRNECTDHFRQIERQRIDELSSSDDDADPIDKFPANSVGEQNIAEREIFYRALLSLSKQQQVFFTLWARDGLTFPEIAKVLRMSQAEVKKAMRALRSRLAKNLAVGRNGSPVTKAGNKSRRKAKGTGAS